MKALKILDVLIEKMIRGKNMNLKQRTLLIVEDEKDIREILSELLSPLNLNILEAEDGQAALDMLRSKEVDAVLSDISMPRVTGLELLSHMKVEFDTVPIVMLTAYGDKANIKEALRLGALDFIEKPFNEESVLDVVNKALEIGVRNKEASHLSTQEGVGEENVARVFNLQQKKRMIGLLTAKHNRDRKKKA